MARKRLRRQPLFINYSRPVFINNKHVLASIAALLLISAGRGKPVELPLEPTRIIPIIETPIAIGPSLEPIQGLDDLHILKNGQPNQYREVPPEDKNPIQFVNPPALLAFQLDNILRWGVIIEATIIDHDYPDEYYMLALGIIAQETQGVNMECQQWRDEICGVGLMAITPSSWTNTEAKLKNPRINIAIGLWMFDSALKRAVDDFNFRPGREATRAALAAYNCGWASLLADRCAWFGGWAFADKILNYWIPLLETRLGE